MSKLPEPTNLTKCEPLHFTVTGEFLMNIARQRYWFEDGQDWAKKLLGALQGMPEEYIMAVINGEGILGGDSDTGIFFKREETEYKKVIEERKVFIKQECIRIGTRRVKKETLTNYGRNIVTRLRYLELRGIEIEGVMVPSVPFTIVMDLENERSRLHQELLKEAGFSPSLEHYGSDEYDMAMKALREDGKEKEFEDFCDVLNKIVDEMRKRMSEDPKLTMERIEAMQEDVDNIEEAR